MIASDFDEPVGNSAELEVSEESLSTSATAPAPAASLKPRVTSPRRRRWPLRVALGLAATAVFSAGAVATAMTLSRTESEAVPATVTTGATARTPAAGLPSRVTPTAAAVGGTTLVVHSEPPGRLSIDGTFVGTTPYEGLVRPGVHLLRLEAEGHAVWRERAALRGGGTHRRQITLEPEG